MQTYSSREPLKSKRARISTSRTSHVTPTHGRKVSVFMMLQRSIGNHALRTILQHDIDKRLGGMVGDVKRENGGVELQDNVGGVSGLLDLHKGIEKTELVEARMSRSFMDDIRSLVGKNYETLGESVCNPRSGKVEWKIHKNKVPKCMWDCAEAHEKEHVKFSSAACKRVGDKNKKIHSWARVLKKAIADKNIKKMKLAEKEVKKALKVFLAVSKWYQKRFHKTCVRNEKQAYKIGNKLCASNKVKRNCQKSGQLNKYKKIMADWRAARIKPPNCKTPSKRRP